MSKHMHLQDIIPVDERYRQNFKRRFCVFPTDRDRCENLDALSPLPVPGTNDLEDERFDHRDLLGMREPDLRRELEQVRLRLLLTPSSRPWIRGWFEDRFQRVEEALANAE